VPATFSAARDAAGRRMIVFSGHIANWEIAMLAGI
jgi:lauroyl/myristoyl acyltransferase